jgi:hypothetical protein
MSDKETKVITYGNWISPQSAGVYGLNRSQTMILFGALLFAIILLMTSGIVPAAIFAGATFLVVKLLAIKDADNLSIMDKIKERIVFQMRKIKKTNIYRSGALGMTEFGQVKLPGLLAGSSLSQHLDIHDNPFVLLYMPNQKTYATVITVEPNGASLVDKEQIDAWVANWGGWINTISNEPGVIGLSVTIDSSPSTSHELVNEIERNQAPNAPKFAKDTLNQIKQIYPKSSSSLKAFVTIVFEKPKAKSNKKSLESFAAEVSTRLPIFIGNLLSCGVGSARPLNAKEFMEYIRCAYDPAAQRLFEDARSAGQEIDQSWNDVGPMATNAYWDYYKHDSGVSKTFFMTSPPRGNVTSNILLRLLSPNRYVPRKRVTLIYKTVPASLTPKIVEDDLQAASFNASSKGKNKRPSARAQKQIALAKKTSFEEANGAGLVEFALVFSATADTLEDIKEANSHIENLAASTRIRIRPAFGTQDSAFAASLPLGVILSKFINFGG